ncbi:hypothetical protein Scep_027898 [Stephania cephalantha]|uniref:Uncharacterized protein n=1 Tax=Stephania cephalantha TaxID=152367 RepID=A0AAP0HLJ8_9MAGN
MNQQLNELINQTKMSPQIVPTSQAQGNALFSNNEKDTHIHEKITKIGIIKKKIHKTIEKEEEMIANVIPTRGWITEQSKYIYFPERLYLWYLARVEAYEKSLQKSEMVNKEKDYKVPDNLNEDMCSYSTVPQQLADAREKENNEHIFDASKKIETNKLFMESTKLFSNYEDVLKEFFI